MSILVIAEHDNKALKNSTLHVFTAALKMKPDAKVSVLVAGKDAADAAKDAASVTGVTEVLYSDDKAYEHFLAENMAGLIAKLAPDFSHVLAPANSFGRNVLPRTAGLCRSAVVSDIIAIEAPDTFSRPIYAGNAVALVKCSDTIKFITVRTTAFDEAKKGGAAAPIKEVPAAGDAGLSHFVSSDMTVSKRPELTAAKTIVSGGRGLGSHDQFHNLIEPLADKLNAAIGASRAAVDSGYVSNDFQIGQTGKIVAPELYIAAGISGAIQHLAGMKDSKVIVAVNKDPDAPIFQQADYGLVGDAAVVLPELTKLI
ncbi:MAG: FAD-binding protein [Alphaproteobacteria bacterium]|nr:FAD-binding protein [Alphaproteobacteria bacterium]MCL2505446.1 FAD-binding protein [Alphaproteobacteria bacterium]